MIALAVRLIDHAIDQATTLPAPTGRPDRDALVAAACYLLAGAAAIGLLLLRNPRSFLSRLVDRPADENTTPEGNHL